MLQLKIRHVKNATTELITSGICQCISNSNTTPTQEICKIYSKKAWFYNHLLLIRFKFPRSPCSFNPRPQFPKWTKASYTTFQTFDRIIIIFFKLKNGARKRKFEILMPTDNHRSINVTTGGAARCSPTHRASRSISEVTQARNRSNAPSAKRGSPPEEIVGFTKRCTNERSGPKIHQNSSKFSFANSETRNEFCII